MSYGLVTGALRKKPFQYETPCNLKIFWHNSIWYGTPYYIIHTSKTCNVNIVIRI